MKTVRKMDDLFNEKILNKKADEEIKFGKRKYDYGRKRINKY